MSSLKISKNYRETMMNQCKIYQREKGNGNYQEGPRGMKSTISELKNTVEGIKSRLDEAED